MVPMRRHPGSRNMLLCDPSEVATCTGSHAFAGSPGTTAAEALAERASARDLWQFVGAEPRKG